ncbi:hypothetical protein DMC30DRAFT_278328 [Rhodotorula diobovata]|uniref:Uncharacterized protein n=1 Tax=Rhodotorula diobovata TaxID=5288 RepID=A0A5C5G799_9BASI|nr:hypothetical protein DMC30DRAFT_278328 [Rhodotorula diobovata]
MRPRQATGYPQAICALPRCHAGIACLRVRARAACIPNSRCDCFSSRARSVLHPTHGGSNGLRPSVPAAARRRAAQAGPSGSDLAAAATAQRARPKQRSQLSCLCLMGSTRLRCARQRGRGRGRRGQREPERCLTSSQLSRRASWSAGRPPVPSSGFVSCCVTSSSMGRVAVASPSLR